MYQICWNAVCYFHAIVYMFAIATQSLILLTKIILQARGRIVHCVVAKRPGGKSSRGRTVQMAKRPRAKRPGGELTKGRNVQLPTWYSCRHWKYVKRQYTNSFIGNVKWAFVMTGVFSFLSLIVFGSSFRTVSKTYRATSNNANTN